MSFHLGANTNNNARAKSTNAVVGAFDFGTTNTTASLVIYTGSQPSTPETGATGTALVTVNFANPSFAASDSTGTAGLAGGSSISATVTTTGTAGYFRIFDRNGNSMGDGTVGTSGADLNLNTTSLVANGTITITSMTFQTTM